MIATKSSEVDKTKHEYRASDAVSGMYTTGINVDNVVNVSRRQ